MLSADDFPAVQRAVQKARQRTERAAGAADQILEQVKAEFGCKTVEAARDLLDRLREQRQAALEKYNRRMVKFKKENAAVLKEFGIEPEEE